MKKSLSAATLCVAVALITSCASRGGTLAGVATNDTLAYAACIDAADAHLRLGELAQANSKLDATPRSKRGWEYRHLRSRADMSLATWLADSGTVTSVKPLPGTLNVLVTCSDGSLQIWDPAQGIALKKYPVLKAPAYDCSPSPDGKRVVVSGQAKNAKVVDIATGEVLFDIGPHESVVAAAEWSPRGDVIALSSYRRVEGVMGVVAEVCIYNAADGARLNVMQTDDHPVSCLAFSPDGSRLLAGTWKFQVFVWDTKNWNVVHKRPIPDHGAYRAVDAVTWTPDGAIFAAGTRDGRITMWDAKTGAQRVQIGGLGDGVRALEFSRDGKEVAAIGDDKLLRVYSKEAWMAPDPAIPNPEPTVSLTGHGMMGWCATYLPNGQLLTGSIDGTIRKWDTRPELIQDFYYMPNGVGSAAWAPDGRMFYTATFQGEIIKFDVTKGKLAASWDHPDTGANNAVLSPDGKRLYTIDWAGKLVAYDTTTKEALLDKTLSSGGAEVAISPDGKQLAIAAGKNTVLAVDAMTGEELFTAVGHTGGVRSVFYSRDSQMIASASADKTVRLWSTKDGAPLMTLEGHTRADEQHRVPGGWKRCHQRG
jgi:WD40 repeat protein